MNYSLGYAFNAQDMFMKFSSDRVKTDWKKCYEVAHTQSKKALAEKIFKVCAELVINDVIENNDIFELPVTGRHADIRVKRIRNNDFKRARKSKKFRNVDFLVSNYTGHELVLNIYTKGYYREKPIYVNKKYRDRLIELTNKGKQYG